LVIVGVRVVLDRTTGALERADEPRANQFLQIAVDRRMRNRRQLAAELIIVIIWVGFRLG
jgi:hypothetical protein